MVGAKRRRRWSPSAHAHRLTALRSFATQRRRQVARRRDASEISPVSRSFHLTGLCRRRLYERPLSSRTYRSIVRHVLRSKRADSPACLDGVAQIGAGSDKAEAWLRLRARWPEFRDSPRNRLRTASRPPSDSLGSAQSGLLDAERYARWTH